MVLIFRNCALNYLEYAAMQLDIFINIYLIITYIINNSIYTCIQLWTICYCFQPVRYSSKKFTERQNFRFFLTYGTKKIVIKTGANKVHCRKFFNCLLWQGRQCSAPLNPSVLLDRRRFLHPPPEVRPQSLDAFGLKLKWTGPRVLMINVFELGLQKSLSQPKVKLFLN